MIVVVSAVLLGGGTHGGFLADTVLELLAIPLLLVSLWRLTASPHPSRVWWGVAFCLAVALVPLAQLVPLPPNLWTALPSRESSAAALQMLGNELPWMPISVSPGATALAALSLLVPAAVFLGTVLLSYRERRWLSLIFVFVGLISVFVGLLQVAQGPASPLRPFEVTNLSEPVGFFANRNHFAALVYTLLIFVAAWTVSAAAALGREARRNGAESAVTIVIIAGFAAVVVLLAAQGMARSRAGFGLTLAALTGAVALMFLARRGSSKVTTARMVLGATVFALLCVGQAALYRSLERFAVEPLEGARVRFARATIEAATAYMPSGSGVGTFIPVFGAYEKPDDMLANTFVNRAHNDLLEVWLETGVAGPLLIAVLVLWLVARAWTLWRRVPPEGHEIDWSLARAATIAVALLLVHSVVDYPLRTGALMAVLAMSCAFLIEPVSGEGREEVKSAGAKRADPAPRPARAPAASTARTAPESPPAPLRPMPDRPPQTPGPSPTIIRPSTAPGGKAASDMDWPEEWRRPPNKPEPAPPSPAPPRGPPRK